MKYPKTALGAAWFVLAIAGCGKSTSSPPAQGSAAAGSAAAIGATTAGASAASAAKLEAAIECLNRHTNRVFEAHDGYLGSVDPATGAAPAGRKPTLVGLYGPDPCERLVKAAGGLTPAVPALDQASAGYVAALAGLRAAWDELGGYYAKGEHLDDQGKRLATLHPKVMGAFDAFGAADRALGAVVRAINRKRHEDDLKAREQAEGRTLEVIIGWMMLEGQSLVETMSTPGADGKALEALAAAYGTLVDEVGAYAGAHPDEAGQRGSLANLRNYSQGFLGAAKVVVRKRLDSAEPTEAERAAALDQYNSLVKNFNNH